VTFSFIISFLFELGRDGKSISAAWQRYLNYLPEACPSLKRQNRNGFAFG